MCYFAVGVTRVVQVQETTAGPGLHNRHFKYTATGGTFMAKISKSNPTISQEAILDNFFAEQTGLEVGSICCCMYSTSLFLGS